MKQIDFLIKGLGPFKGYTDGFSFMGEINVYVDRYTLKEMSDHLYNSEEPSVREFAAELSIQKIGPDGLSILPKIGIQIVEGYHVVESKDKRDYSYATAKDVYLDGHFFDIYVDAPHGLSYYNIEISHYGSSLRYHGCFPTLEEALLHMDALGVSMRSSAEENKEDLPIRNHEIVKRRYMHPWYKIGDLSKSVGDIPSQVFALTARDVKSWAEDMLEKAKKFEPLTYWYMGTTPLERFVQKQKLSNEV